MATPEETAQRLYNRNTMGIRLGLDRMRRAAELIGNSQTNYPSVHVAGTNGKGSTCAYIESVMRAHGVKTGLFTSPHLVRFEERFIIGGRPVSGQQWTAVFNDIAGVIETLHLTFFEATTLIAFELFKREKVEWAIFETGLGGRLDATNIIIPKVAVITALGLDHTEYLGNDLVSVAREKLGIVKRHIPLVIARPEERDVSDAVREQCAAMEAPCIFVSADDAIRTASFGDSTVFPYAGRMVRTPLLGEYQVQNAMVALTALAEAGFCEASKTDDGIARTAVPGRFQVVGRDGRFVVFDVGHNPAAAKAFVTALKRRFPGHPPCIIAGVMKDKDVSGVLRQYSSVASRLIVTKPKIGRAADCETLLRGIPADFRGGRDCSTDVDQAVTQALRGREEVICVAGSFYTVGEAMKALGIKPYETAD
jgi:dihydrofolate synthase / folylpolyglutamate synthase